MRSIVAGALLTLAVEALLALAFWAGSAWLGSWLAWPWGGITLAAAVLILMAAFLLGDLEVDYDTTGHQVDVRVGWIARISSREREAEPGRITRTRVLFVSWSRLTAALAPDARPIRVTATHGGRSSWITRLAEGAEPVSRALAAAAPAIQELIWESREMTLRVESPTQIGIADRALAGIVGHRRFGPIAIHLADGGERALKARYRIRLYRATLAAVSAFVQGRPDRAVRALGHEDRPANPRGDRAARRE
jgi:hypothetical protein